MSRASELLDQIDARNRSHAALVNEAAPEVGIFWIHPKTNELIGVHSEPHETASHDSMFVNSDVTHFDMWRSLKRARALPEFQYSEYDEVPRGRVIYNKTEGKHMVYGPRHLIGKRHIQSKILSEFHLPGSKTKFMPDEHYSMEM